MSNTSNQLEIITPADLQTAQGVHEQSKGWLAAYEKAHAALVKKATDPKLTSALDTEMNKFQVSARAALKTMNENRTPFTEKAHAFVKMFTDMENRIKALDGDIQALRNASAAAYAKEEAEKREQERLDLARKTERIELLARAEQQVRDAYSAILQGDKDELLTAFESITLETLPVYEALLKDINPVLKYERWEAIKVIISPTQLNSQEEIDAIITQALLAGDKFDKCAAHYKSEIIAYAAHLLTLIPHRREGLLRGEQESKEAAALRAKQAQLEADQAKAAAEAAAKKAEAERAAAVLDQQVEQANRAVEQPRAIESYSITVTNRQGWVEIFKFYLANTDPSENDLGKVKLDSMRLLAERMAKSTGVKIDSPHVVYEAKYKVAVKKSATKSRKAA